jgi:hypothetical protein
VADLIVAEIEFQGALQALKVYLASLRVFIHPHVMIFLRCHLFRCARMTLRSPKRVIAVGGGRKRHRQGGESRPSLSPNGIPGWSQQPPPGQIAVEGTQRRGVLFGRSAYYLLCESLRRRKNAVSA